ncbi:unnamed protein product [Tetraodon nigroviridis]|uniref:Protein N-terminal glutamine amidohydrolase n=1 Tax=Tetraodon nigroviridis TaxID=99883 RepID=Q4RIY0_TETNG|nr:unnamed protein product [Tetraodon nigroviridis]
MRREDCVYTSCYCEENVWKLCEFARGQKTPPLEELLVVFISNASRMVPLWRQRSGYGDQPVVWDYHVILLQVGLDSDPQVYDLDSDLSFPCSMELYASQALRSDRSLRPAYHRRFRVIPADSFLLNFASDRSHMRNADGSWKMPPPPYPPIHTAAAQTQRLPSGFLRRHQHRGPAAARPRHGALPAPAWRPAQPNPLRFLLITISRQQRRSDDVPVLQPRQPGWKRLGRQAAAQADRLPSGQQELPGPLVPFTPFQR